jgi:transcriptional regulator with GAF, ATPase, and Fis domain
MESVSPLKPEDNASQTSEEKHAPSGQTLTRPTFVEQVREFERTLIRQALEEAQGSVTRAARALGLTHQGLCYIINHRHKELLTSRAPFAYDASL